MPFNIPLAGKIEPKADSWRDATPADRRGFYRRAGEVAVRVLRAQLLRAVGADGGKMMPRQKPRRDGADGPVMDPHRARSRTYRLLGFKATERGVTVFWHGGVSRAQRLPWGKILSFHATGQVIGAYLRDVRLSDGSVAAVRSEMSRWWANRTRTLNAAKRRRAAGQAPPAAPAAAAAPRGRRPIEVVPARKGDRPKRPTYRPEGR